MRSYHGVLLFTVLNVQPVKQSYKGQVLLKYNCQTSLKLWMLISETVGYNLGSVAAGLSLQKIYP